MFLYESAEGGWGYYDFGAGTQRPNSSSTSFVNAAVLEAFYEAKAIGVLPPGKLVKIVSIARSDEHVFNLKGGRGTKSGQPARAAADYTLNSEGQVHSALIGTETLSLVIYRGEPDENLSFEVVDAAPVLR